jgi:hypothetical protein
VAKKRKRSLESGTGYDDCVGDVVDASCKHDCFYKENPAFVWQARWEMYRLPAKRKKRVIGDLEPEKRIVLTTVDVYKFRHTAAIAYERCSTPKDLHPENTCTLFIVLLSALARDFNSLSLL